MVRRCLDDLSTHKQTTRQFYEHYQSTQQTICCENSPLTFLHLYDPSRYFSSTPASRWTVCHIWHDVHPPQNALWHHDHPFLKWNLDGLSHDFWIHWWCPAGCSAKCGHFVIGFFWHVGNVHPAFQQIVDILSHDFWLQLWCPSSCSATCGSFVTGF